MIDAVCWVVLGVFLVAVWLKAQGKRRLPELPPASGPVVLHSGHFYPAGRERREREDPGPRVPTVRAEREEGR